MKFFKDITKEDRTTVNPDSAVDMQVQQVMWNIYTNAKAMFEKEQPNIDINGNKCIEIPKTFSTYIDEFLRPDALNITFYSTTHDLNISETNRGMLKAASDRSFDESSLIIRSSPEYLTLGSFDADTGSYRNVVLLKVSTISENGPDIVETRINQRYFDPEFMDRLHAMNNELVYHLNQLNRNANIGSETPSMTS